MATEGSNQRLHSGKTTAHLPLPSTCGIKVFPKGASWLRTPRSVLQIGNRWLQEIQNICTCTYPLQVCSFINIPQPSRNFQQTFEVVIYNSLPHNVCLLCKIKFMLRTRSKTQQNTEGPWKNLDVYIIEKQWKVVLQIRSTIAYFAYCLLKATWTL